jgi:hypothetical protein
MMAQNSTTSASASVLALFTALAVGGGASVAADLGGNCCADLEERVAELEATTTRKGNRKMSLQVYGQVSESVIWWNDGGERNVYVVENNYIKNRLGVQGSAKINSDWSAGYRLEMQIRAYRSSSADQLALGASNAVTITAYNTRAIALRHANWYLQSATYGRITVGRDNDATSGVSNISLVNPDGFSGMTGPGYIMDSFFVRRAGTKGTTGLSEIGWGDIAFLRNGDGPASLDYSQSGSNVKYTSPFLLGKTKSSGFQFQAAAGMDDHWSAALRYVEDFGLFRLAAGIGYNNWRGMDRTMCSTGPSSTAGRSGSALAIPGTTGPNGTAIGSSVDCKALHGSASLMHVPSGLYVSGGGGQITDNGIQMAANLASTNLGGSSRRGIDGEHGIWWVQAGWQAKLNTLGSTIFWGQHVVYNTGLGVRSNVVQTVAANDVINSLGTAAFIAGSATRIWGGGITQNIDAAAMNVHIGVHNYSLEAVLLNQSASATNQRALANPIADATVVYTGATLKF